MANSVISENESKVRSYCLSFPAEFNRAFGSYIYDSSDVGYLDFLSGCGSLNYGHNHEAITQTLVEYIQSQGITMSLDLETKSKAQFILAFSNFILTPRNLDYKFQFPGPTGTNAVEAAIKLARKYTGRTNIIAFTNAFHGCSLGSLALTGSSFHREASKSQLNNVTRIPYENYFGKEIDTAALLDQMLSDQSGGFDKPAAIILEAIQGEGGLNVASAQWAKKIQEIAKKHNTLLIVDEIQTGCGRSGDFFAFESLGIDPDVICLAKSLSGLGLPMSMVLLKPEIDCWKPAEHNGTFRGNNYAFVTAAKSIELFWKDANFISQVRAKADLVIQKLRNISRKYGFKHRGRGLMVGLDLVDGLLASNIQKLCFEQNLIVETCGPNDEVLKLLPPLNVSYDELETAFNIIEQTIIRQQHTFKNIVGL